MEQLVFYFLIFDCRCRSCCAAVKTTGVQCNSAAETQSRWRAKENIWAGKLPEPEEQALYRGTTVLDGAAVCVWLCSEQRSCRLHTVTADDSLPLTGQISVTLNGFTGSSENLFSLSEWVYFDPPPTGASCVVFHRWHSLCWWWCPERFDSAAEELWVPRGH